MLEKKPGMGGFGEAAFMNAGHGPKGKGKNYDPDMVRIDHLDLEAKPGGPVHIQGHGHKKAGHDQNNAHKKAGYDRKAGHDAWAPAVHAHDLVDRTPHVDWQGGSLVSRLASQPTNHNKLGRLLNQLQILGMDKTHLTRLENQLIAAVGDNSGKKLRLLQQAISRLVADRSYPEIPKPPPEAPPPEMDLEEQLEQARTVTTYEQSGHAHWVQEENPTRPDNTRLRPKHLTPFLGDNHDLMLEGKMTNPASAVEELFELETGKPMLSAAVTMEMPDYLGATQLGTEDKLNTRFRLIPSKQEDQAMATSRAEQFRDLRNVAKSGPKRVQGTVMAGIHHPHENAKAAEMRRRVCENGRCSAEQEFKAPCPGTEFWRSLVLASTDLSKSGCYGGNKLLPPLQLKIPETVCFSDVGGGSFLGFYTESDGFVYRGFLPKDAAGEWLSRMRRRRIRKMSKRKAYTMLDKEPWYLMRFSQSEVSGNEHRALMTEASLKSAMNEANPLQLTIWQGFIRSRGGRAKIHRVLFNFEKGGEESGHYMLSSTSQMGAADAPQGGFFCLSHDLEGSKATGRSTVINNVQPGALPDQVEAACNLALYATQVFPFRKDRKGKLKQRYPKFAAERIVVDWLVDREGVWYFSQVYAFHARQLAAKGGIVVDEKAGGDSDALTETISLLEKHLDYIKLALEVALPPGINATELSTLSAALQEHSLDGTGLESPQDDASAADGTASEAGRTWAEKSTVRFRSKSKESVLSQSAKSSAALAWAPAASAVCAPPLHTIARLAQNPRTQKTGSRMLRDVVVKRVTGQQSLKAVQATTPAGGGKEMAALDRRLNSLVLSSHAAPNPIHDLTLQRRLGAVGEAAFEPEQRRTRALSAMKRSDSVRPPRSASPGHHDARKQALGKARPVSAAPILTSAATAEPKQSAAAAASAPGRPI